MNDKKKSIFVNAEEFFEEETVEVDSDLFDEAEVLLPIHLKPGTAEMERFILGEAETTIRVTQLGDLEEVPLAESVSLERPKDLAILKTCPRCNGLLTPAIAINGAESLSFNECKACGTLINTFKPIKYQAEAAARPERYILLAGGFGCMGYDSKVLMANLSVKAIQDVVVGDLVMGVDGKPRTVLELHRGYDTAYEVTPKKSVPMVFNGNHIMHLHNHEYKYAVAKGHVRGAHWYDGEYSHPTINEYLTKSKRYKANHRWVFNTIPLEQPEQTLSIPPYMLGVLLGDGYLGQGCSFTSNDATIVESVRSLLLNGYKLSVSPKQGTTACAYNIAKAADNRTHRTNYYTNSLKDLGLYGTKSHNKFVPDIYKRASVQQRLDLLAGLIDTDGYNGSNYFEITLKSKQLIEDIIFIAHSVGLRCTYSEKKLKYKKEVRVYFKATIWGNSGAIPTRVARKQITNKPNKSYSVSAFDIKQVQDQNYYGITVDQDSLYIEADNFTIIHNSGKSKSNIEKIISHLVLIPNARVVVAARTYPAIEGTFVKDFFSVMPQRLLRRKNEMKHEWVFTNGSELIIRSFDDPTKLRGINATMFVLLEASNIMYEGFELAQNRVRNTAAMVPEFNASGEPVFKYDEKSKSMRPVYAHDARKILIETNPDSGWVKTKFLVDSATVSYYGSAHKEGYRMNAKLDPNKFTLVMATDANPYLPEGFIEEQTRGKSPAYIQQFFYGSFNFSENLVYPNVGARVVQPHPLPPEFDEQGKRALWYVIGLDYGINDALAIVYGAYSSITKKIYFFDELYEHGLNIADAVAKHRDKMKLYGITNQKLMMLPLFDGRSYNKREANLQTIGALFNAEGLYFTPSFTYNDARIVKFNGIINDEQIEIFSNMVCYIEEVTNYKFKPNKDGTISDKPVDKNNHAINAGEFIIMALPINLNNFNMSAYVPQGTIHMHDTEEGRNNDLNRQTFNPYQGGSTNDNNRTSNNSINTFVNNRYGSTQRHIRNQNTFRPQTSRSGESGEEENIFTAFVPKRSK